jgi:hypothetical protein
MLFVTKYKGYQVMVQRDITRRVPSNEGDDAGWVSVVTRPLIMAEFKPHGVLTYHQRRVALEFFDSQETGEDGMPPGAYRNGNVASDPDFAGMVYNGSDHWLRFSTFDTEKDCPWIETMDPAEVKALCEKTLLGSAQLGSDYILVDQEKVAPPWDTYETTHHKKIASLTRDLQRDPLEVIEYEKQRAEPREGVIADLERLVEQQSAEAEAINQLTVRG